MKFEAKNTYAVEWKKRFALLPVTVGVSSDGEVLHKVWLEFYEKRRDFVGGGEYFIENRALSPRPGFEPFRYQTPWSAMGAY